MVEIEKVNYKSRQIFMWRMLKCVKKIGCVEVVYWVIV